MAMRSIAKPHSLSVQTALRLFDIKIAPVATYGIEVIWQHLTAKNLRALDGLKARYIKKVLSLHLSTKNRHVYLITGSTTLVEDLMKQRGLPETDAYRQSIQEWERKFSEVDESFYRTDAMTQSGWKEPGRTGRHIVTRYAVHGFHHILCTSRGHHEPADDCICRRCKAHCHRYHAGECSEVKSLSELLSLDGLGR